MNIKIGDVLVFIGRKDGGKLCKHFKNFQIGKRYEISHITQTWYEMDESNRMEGYCVLFKNSKYGCYEDQISDYFVYQFEWRDSLISSISKIFKNQ
jgi:hypothetical protein